MKLITIDNKEYQLDINKAKELGVLKEIEVCEGNIYGNDYTNLLLIKTSYDQDLYQFLGLYGEYMPYPHNEFKHPMPLRDVKLLLKSRGYVFKRKAPKIQ